MKRFFALILAAALALSLAGCITIYREVEREETEKVQNQTVPDDPATEEPALSQDNPYRAIYEQYPDYILRGSYDTFLCWDDISGLSAQERELLAQEIRAIHGQTFTDAHLKEYFSARTWYAPASSGELPTTAQANLTLLEVYEAVKNGSIAQQDNPYISAIKTDYVIPDSSHRLLEDKDLEELSADALLIARNEIMARNGYVFSDSGLRNYFYSKSWYRPTTAGADFNFDSLNDTEVKNVNLIQAYERGDIVKVPDCVQTIDKFTYVLNNGSYHCCYHIPYLDMATASAVNKKMYDTHYKHLQEDVFATPDQPFLVSMVYAVNRKGDAVSVVVIESNDWGSDHIYVYNFSASTGAMLTNAEFYAACGMSEAEGIIRISMGINSYWDNSPYTGADKEELRQRTLSDENCASFKPFLREDGIVAYAGYIYSPAGAEKYQHMLTSGGNTFTYTCSVH